MAVSVVFGILVGTFYANHFSGNRLSIINNGSNRLNNLLRIIDDQYVDSVNIDDLVDKAIPQILAQLDPHSTYISAEDVQKVNSELKGSFSGVGIEFTIQRDTIPPRRWACWPATRSSRSMASPSSARSSPTPRRAAA